jgi:hypothetical protein
MDSRQEVVTPQEPVNTPDQPSLYIKIDDVIDEIQFQEEEKDEKSAEVDDFSSLPT